MSWFEVNGYGCKPTYPMNITSEDPYRPVRPERVDGCLLDYHIVEITHSGVQCALAVSTLDCRWFSTYKSSSKYEGYSFLLVQPTHGITLECGLILTSSQNQNACGFLTFFSLGQVLILENMVVLQTSNKFNFEKN